MGTATRWLAVIGTTGLVLPLLVAGPSATAVPQPQPAAVSPAGSPALSLGVAESRRMPAPDGWQVSIADDGARVSWRSQQPLPLTASAIEFWLGHTLLGTPRPAHDGRTFVLQHDGALPGPASQLRVTKGGLPLDARGQTVQRQQTTGTSGPVWPSAVTRHSVFDPGVPGPYATARSDYELADLPISPFPNPVEVVGAVVSPVGATGPRPLALFLHGRHSTCFKGGPDGRSSGDWPCRRGWSPIPSHLGYLDAQELLASQGYVTVSIAANGINGQDWEAMDGGAQARSELVRHHLGLWEQWATTGGAPFGSTFVGAVDLDHVLLVGHSRGGEGVNRAALDTTATDPWTIDGQVLIGPTAFGRQTALGVDTTVLLPHCDGDVSDLQGQQYVDQVRDLLSGGARDPALRSAVMVMGANHNYFNLEWTPGPAAAPSWDDWGDAADSACGTSSRLRPREQRTAGAVYVAASAAAFVEQRAAALPILNGTPARPASLGDTTTFVTALGARRTGVYYPTVDLPAPRAVGAEAVVCEGYRNLRAVPACVPPRYGGSVPHFLPMYEAYRAPAPQGLHMSWDTSGGRVRIGLGGDVDLGRATSLEMRVGVLNGGGPARFAVQAVDAAGGRHELGTVRLRQLPGGRSSFKVWGRSAQLPLPAGMPDTVQALRLLPQSSNGDVVLLDVSARRSGASTAPVPVVPRVDVVERTIVEGDGGIRTEQIRVEVTGPVDGTQQLWLTPPDLYYVGLPGFLVELAPGQSVINVPVEVDGDVRDDYDAAAGAYVKAIRNVVTGHWAGTVTLTDDDPAPQLDVTRVWDDAVEGQRLRWELTLSEPSDKWVGVQLVPTAPASGIELALADLTVRFRERYGLPTGDRQTPLSRSRLELYSSFEPGDITTGASLPFRVDDVVEGIERLYLASFSTEAVGSPPLRGRVTDG